jgi:hypothetical protein
MGMGQTMMTVAFLVLLTIAVFNANKMIVDKSANYYKQEALKEGSYLAQSLLTEIGRKLFDSKVYSITLSDTSYGGYLDCLSFDAPNSLGPNPTASNYVNPSGAADTYPYKSIRADNSNYFDDIDDYKGYLRVADNVSTLRGFKLKVSDVYYVDTSGQKSNVQTYLKKITVKVWNPYYLAIDTLNPKTSDTLTFSTIISY